MMSNSTGTNSNQSGRNPARFGRIGLRVRKMAEKPRLAKGAIPPMRKKILAIVCILLAVTMIAMLALENGVILLWRQDVAVPDSVTAENAYAYVLALAERDERATPFYLSLNAGEDAAALGFTLCSYVPILADEGLYAVDVYEHRGGRVVQSKYIGTAPNWKAWASDMYLASDAHFSENTAALYAKVLSEVESGAELTMPFPVTYCDAQVFSNAGLEYSEQ